MTPDLAAVVRAATVLEHSMRNNPRAEACHFQAERQDLRDALAKLDGEG